MCSALNTNLRVLQTVGFVTLEQFGLKNWVMFAGSQWTNSVASVGLTLEFV